MKYSFSFLFVCLLSFIIVFSCSNEEDDAPTPDAIVKKYTLAVTAGEGGTVSSSGGTYSQGTQVSITATPSSGFTFSQWSNGSTTNPITVTLNSNTNLSATFAAIINTYTLTVSAAEGGTVSTEGGTYDEGTEVTIIATPSEGYRFTGWEGNTSTEESLTITLNSDQTLQALFELIPIYTLTVTTSEGGTVSTEGGEYEEGTEVEITASAYYGYIFNGWEGSNSQEKSITISLNSNIALVANFSPINTTNINNDTEVFNYDINEDYTEQIVDFYPNAFFASDLSREVVNGINLALKKAADEFGKYGPVEYWVFGTDKQAALDLINKFCERREYLNQWTISDCLRRETDETLDYSMIAYQKIGENVILNNRPQGNAGHNGGFQWGIHRLSSSYPFSFDNLFEGIPPQDDIKTVLHEYFHVYQNASVFNLSREERNTRTKPDDAIWMMEGAAEYMANYTLFKLINNGTFDFEKSYGSLREKMRNKMNNGKIVKEENCPNSKLNGFTYQFCNKAGYELGSWGVAFLLNKVNDQNILLNTFYPNLKELGFEGAFNLAFGYSSEEFYEEFNAFLELPIEEQLEIIPDI